MIYITVIDVICLKTEFDNYGSYNKSYIKTNDDVYNWFMMMYGDSEEIIDEIVIMIDNKQLDVDFMQKLFNNTIIQNKLTELSLINTNVNESHLYNIKKLENLNRLIISNKNLKQIFPVLTEMNISLYLKDNNITFPADIVNWNCHIVMDSKDDIVIKVQSYEQYKALQYSVYRDSRFIFPEHTEELYLKNFELEKQINALKEKNDELTFKLDVVHKRYKKELKACYKKELKACGDDLENESKQRRKISAWIMFFKMKLGEPEIQSMNHIEKLKVLAVMFKELSKIERYPYKIEAEIANMRCI